MKMVATAWGQSTQQELNKYMLKVTHRAAA